jgi:ABC-type ATPase involved in cell division
MPHFIEFENVKKVYGSGAAEVRALDGVSFGVDEGSSAYCWGHRAQEKRRF